MSWLDDATEVVKNMVGGGGRDSGKWEDALKGIVDPIGSYVVKKARANDSYEPSEADKQTALEQEYARSRIPSKSNPAVSGVKWYDDDSAASAAGRRKQQTVQLGRISKTAPTYWSNLVNAAAGYKAQSKNIYNQNSGSYEETYITNSLNGIISSWLGGNSSGGNQQQGGEQKTFGSSYGDGGGYKTYNPDNKDDSVAINDYYSSGLKWG